MDLSISDLDFSILSDQRYVFPQGLLAIEVWVANFPCQDFNKHNETEFPQQLEIQGGFFEKCVN
jgi:hypothetical protein